MGSCVHREHLARSLGSIDHEDVWDRFSKCWAALESGLDPSSACRLQVTTSEDTRINLTVMMAKLERNLIAGLAEHQQGAM